MLRGFVMTVIKKLPHAKPGLGRTGDDWEKCTMTDMLDNLRQWLKRQGR